FVAHTSTKGPWRTRSMSRPASRTAATNEPGSQTSYQRRPSGSSRQPAGPDAMTEAWRRPPARSSWANWVRTPRLSASERWTSADLDAVLREETPRIGSWLDSSDQTPDDTVDAILRVIDPGVSVQR